MAKLKAHTPLLAIILSLLAVGYTIAQEVIREETQKVVVIPMGGDSGGSPDLSALEARITALENAAPGIESRLTALEGDSPPNLNTRLIALEGTVAGHSIELTSLGNAIVLLAQNGVPGGVVAPFNSSTCPTGWQKYANAQGRFVKGMTENGRIGTQVGQPIAHQADISHSHIWIEHTAGASGVDWRTRDIDGFPLTMMHWGDGIDNEGTGIYPVAIEIDPVTNSGTRQFRTREEFHTPPYVQLLYCEKV